MVYNAKVNIVKKLYRQTSCQKKEINSYHFEPNDPNEEALHISYNELYERVCKMANVLKNKAYKRRSCLYLLANDSWISDYHFGVPELSHSLGCFLQDFPLRQ
jgi:acyl-coenzyme A synthetase/AMP-(fatty) acid ligase